ncbi:MAG: serine hydrolase, partial [Anaerolineales bacterium]
MHNYLLSPFVCEILPKTPEKDKTYAEIVNERIIHKLHLQNTFYGGKINPEENQARSYVRSENEWELTPETDMSVPKGAGALVSTPKDLNTFYYNLFEGKLVSPGSLEVMKTTRDGTGMGLMQVPFNDIEV